MVTARGTLSREMCENVMLLISRRGARPNHPIVHRCRKRDLSRSPLRRVALGMAWLKAVQIIDGALGMGGG